MKFGTLIEQEMLYRMTLRLFIASSHSFQGQTQGHLLGTS